jgi:hypothetical protein
MPVMMTFVSCRVARDSVDGVEGPGVSSDFIGGSTELLGLCDSSFDTRLSLFDIPSCFRRFGGRFWKRQSVCHMSVIISEGRHITHFSELPCDRVVLSVAAFLGSRRKLHCF